MERERKRTTANDVEKDGIRKAALFLSILDAEAADALLARFEPDVARAVEAEARRVGSVAPEDVDAIVAEFLALNEPGETPGGFGESGASSETQKARETAKPEKGEKPEGAPEAASERERNEGTRRRGERSASSGVGTDGDDGDDGNGGDWSGDGSDDGSDDGDFSPLDAVEPERLARILSDAAATTVAVALARLSERRRSAVVALLPAEKTRSARRALAAFARTTDAARRLEDALFNGALDDE